MNEPDYANTTSNYNNSNEINLNETLSNENKPIIKSSNNFKVESINKSNDSSDQINSEDLNINKNIDQ